jgi:hypothetical protein
VTATGPTRRPVDRRISPEHLRRLRAIVVRAGSVHAAFGLLKTSPDVVADALTGKTFQAKTIAKLEAAIDAHVAEHLPAET